jgi:hypothetical protein
MYFLLIVTAQGFFECLCQNGFVIEFHKSL